MNIISINTLIFGKIKYVKDEIVTSTGFTNATPQRKVLFIDRVTGYSNGFEGVITKVMYNQSINSTSINTCVMQSTIETRVVKVGDFVIIKEEYILYKGNPFEHVFIFLSKLMFIGSLQGGQLWIKMGVKSKTIHSLSQALGTGVVFLELQLKEYTAAFLTFRDSIFGSDFYGTTCLHGLHVTTGSTSFGIL